jgi:hypothetical protein
MADDRQPTERRAARRAAARELDQILEDAAEGVKNVGNASARAADELSRIMQKIAEGSAYLTAKMKAEFAEQQKYMTQKEREFEMTNAQVEAMMKLEQQMKKTNERIDRTRMQLTKGTQIEGGTAKFLKDTMSPEVFKQALQTVIDNVNSRITQDPERKNFIKQFSKSWPALENLLENSSGTIKISQGTLTPEQVSGLLEALTTPKKPGKFKAEFDALDTTLRQELDKALVAANKNINEMVNLNNKRIEEDLNKNDLLEKAVRASREHGATIANDIMKSMGMNKHVQTLGDAVAKFATDAEKLGPILEKAANILRQDFFKEASLSMKHKGSELFGNSISTNINAYDNTVEFMRAIGQDRTTMGSVIDDTMISLRDLNITSREAIATQRELYLQMSSFSELGKGAQMALTEHAAVLGRIGVSASTSARLFQAMSKSMNTGNMKGLSTDMVNFARALGESPDKSLGQFTANLSQFLRYGSRSVETFKDLAVVAKKTGVEISELIGIAKGFDTFEGAADKVGQLNAILGGPFLNTMQFIKETDVTKRIQMIADAIKKSGKDISEYYTSDAISSIVGGNGVETLNKILNQNLTNVQSHTAALNAQGRSMMDLNKIARDYNVTSNDFTTTTMENISGVGRFNDTVQGSIQTMNSLSGVTQMVGVGLQVFSVAMNMAGMAALATKLKIDSATLSAARLGMALKGVGILGGIVSLGYSLTDGEAGTAGSLLSGIAGGAMIGASFGPIGAAVGALAGGAIGMFASGTDNAPGGLSLVGENGPELVVLPQHSSVINNRNLSRLASSSSSSSSSSTMNQFGGGGGPVSSTMNQFGGGGGPVSLTVVVKLDGDVLAKHTEEIVIDTVEKTLNIVMN